MDITTLFLAKLFGSYLIIMGGIMLLRRELFMQRVKQLMDNDGASLMSAIITLIMGLLLVISHNYWAWDWSLVITLFCWLTLLKGIVLLFFEEFGKTWSARFFAAKIFYPYGVFLVIVGVILLYLGLA